MSEQTFVIVGASLAGAKAAEELREQGFDGRLLLIGSETERPYERPPLSKDYLQGKAERDKTYVHEAGFYEEHDIDLRTGTTVQAIDPRAGRVRLEDGEEIGFDRLLLSTGADVRRLNVPGADLDGVFYLRSLEDSDALRGRIRQGGHVAVIGSGWIGSEVAASARQMGAEVTIIDQANLPNEKVFGREVGEFYRDVHASHGVNLLLGQGVEALEGEGSVHRVRTTEGNMVDCDFVAVGVGVAPRTGLAERAGLDVDGGVLVDEALRTSAENVFAAGDVVSQAHPFYGQRIHVEHWANALNQGPAAARGMLGQSSPYERLPYFFSDQYDVGMEYTGYGADSDEVMFRGSRDDGEFIAFWLAEGRVVAGMNVNVWDVTEPIQALIRARREVDRNQLADPDTPLESLTD
ncbi:MAG TPA: FAD-dependent oxidoreductase [Solirubrobacteraceae bacterium]|jgi:3-phenylpropionate/trans-cinnamate dioxygenase ferredoxin reductase subunit|nr:FAD-dependent oxidoreductase [Solirubrobacteraceae bacterium]